MELFFQVCTFSSSLFQLLEDLICSAFISKLLGHDIPEQDLATFFTCSIGWIRFVYSYTAARQHVYSQHI